MEHVLKILLQFCKDYCKKNAPSKKVIHTVISRLEREGEIKAPQEVFDHWRWDHLTSALAQYVMNSQKGGLELKTWGLILRALKAAREEGKVWEESRRLWSPDQTDPGGGSQGVSSDVKQECRPGGSLSCRNSDEEHSTKMVPSDPNTPGQTTGDKQQDGGIQPSAPLLGEDTLSQGLESPPP